MMGRLEIFYSGRENNLRPDVILPGGYYVAKSDINYYRVRALEVTEKEVNCFLIDIGDETFIPKEDVFELRREFAVAQAQVRNGSKIFKIGRKITELRRFEVFLGVRMSTGRLGGFIRDVGLF